MPHKPNPDDFIQISEQSIFEDNFDTALSGVWTTTINTVVVSGKAVMTAAAAGTALLETTVVSVVTALEHKMKFAISLPSPLVPGSIIKFGIRSQTDPTDQVYFEINGEDETISYVTEVDGTPTKTAALFNTNNNLEATYGFTINEQKIVFFVKDNPKLTIKQADLASKIEGPIFDLFISNDNTAGATSSVILANYVIYKAEVDAATSSTVTVAGTVTVDQVLGSSSTAQTITLTNTPNEVLLPVTMGRKMVTLFNASGIDAYIGIGPDADSAGIYSFILANGDYWEMGVTDTITAHGTGDIKVTEIL